MTLVIEAQGFGKKFKRSAFSKPRVAAEDISLSVPEGSIFGFLGPNGAGKTTTIKALLGLIRPDTGTLKILGRDPNDFSWRHEVGYAAEHPVFPLYLTGLEMVSWFAELSGMSSADAQKKAQEALELVGLGGHQNSRLKGYSKGMLQRSALAQAIVGKPKLLILDEPMTGLDPVGRRDVRDLILEMRSRGTTVFYSTHILPDIEATCDRVAIVDKGRSFASDKLDQLLKDGGETWEVVVDKAPADTSEPAFTDPQTGHVRFSFSSHPEALAFSQKATSDGATLQHFSVQRPSLEEIFLQTLGDKS